MIMIMMMRVGMVKDTLAAGLPGMALAPEVTLGLMKANGCVAMAVGVQTMLLSESFQPGSSGNVASFVFSLILAYLRKGGKIVQHVDEEAEADDVSKNSVIAEREEENH